MKKRTLGNVMATSVSLVVGILTIWTSVYYLRTPSGLLDWIVLVLSGITTGIIAFFIIWGHFQSEPVVGS